MKSSGKTLPSMKRQEEILQFFLANIKSAELENLLARALKRKRKGLPVRSSLKTASPPPLFKVRVMNLSTTQMSDPNSCSSPDNG